jgi:hypothetical protein
MICEFCVEAGALNLRGIVFKARDNHEQCKGDCPCQHKTGPGWVKRDGTPVPLMQTQSP